MQKAEDGVVLPLLVHRILTFGKIIIFEALINQNYGHNRRRDDIA